MALALSVGPSNGAVSSRANQRISSEGIDSRGKRAAWASGAEKSRQIRQFTGATAFGFGFEAEIAAMSGREESGIGGGDPPSDLADGVALGRVGSWGRLGSGGTDFGGGSRGTVGEDVVGLIGSLGASSIGSFAFRVGKGGRVDGSYSGASIFRLLPTLIPDVVDIADAVESVDPLLCQLYEGRRSTAGPLGRRGGSRGDTASFVAVDVLRGSCGATSSFVAVDVLRGGNTGVSSVLSRLYMLAEGGGLIDMDCLEVIIFPLGIKLPLLVGLTTPLFVALPFGTCELDRGGRLGSGGGGRLGRVAGCCSDIA
jgi:hypothetical protein